MSQAILTLLRERTAFKPKPPDYELALAHVPPGQVGLPNPIEQRVRDAMRSDDEAFIIILGPPGCGKTSLLSAVAWDAAKHNETPRVLPLRIAVGHHTARLDPALLVRAVSEELGAQLAPLLNKRQKEQLEKALAVTITRSRQPTRISAALSASVPPGGLNLGVQLATDLTTLTRQGGWQGGTHSGLLALRDIAAAHDARLVVIFDDTDTWSEGDEDMALRARDFFIALRAVVDCPEITIFVAVQDHWNRSEGQSRSKTQLARLQYRELEQRAARCLRVPLPSTIAQARALMKAILERRIEITLDEDPPDDGWCTNLFTNDALDTLATRCLQRNVRQALADVRDAFDHTDVMPERIDRQQLLDAMG